MNAQPVWKCIVVALAAALVAGCAAGGQPVPAQDKAGAQTLVLNLATVDSVAIHGRNVGQMAFIEDLDIGVSWPDQGRHDPGLRRYGARTRSPSWSGRSRPATWTAAGLRRARSRTRESAALRRSRPRSRSRTTPPSKALVSGAGANGSPRAARRDAGSRASALAVGPLRRPFAAQAPLLGVAGLEGRAVPVLQLASPGRHHPALGATPINAGSRLGRPGRGRDTARGRVRHRPVRVERQRVEAPYVTANVVLWPKVFVLALSQKRWDDLETDSSVPGSSRQPTLATKASVDAT